MHNTLAYIFDLDGTLYDFGSDCFSTSRLGAAVRKRYYQLIEQRTNEDPYSYFLKMMENEKKTGIGLSLQLGQTIGETRARVFEMTWGNLEPKSIIACPEYAQKVIPALMQHGKRSFVVTAAPRVWAHKALNHIGIKHYFESIFSLEDFVSSKQEVFGSLLSKTGIAPEQCISIGDQEESDILPAQALGMQTLHVRTPKDILKLL